MTFVATLAPDGYPILMGDLLITADTPAINCALPSTGPIDTRSTRIVAIRQKLCLITDNLAVGWSGCYNTADKTIRRMIDHFRDGGPVTLSNVQEFLATLEYDDMRRDRLNLVGLCSDNSRVRSFGLNASEVHLPLFNECRMAGSGAGYVIHSFKNFSSHYFDGIKNLYVRSLVKSLFAGSVLIGLEVATHQTLSMDFGGLYEFVCYDGSRFYKLSDINLLFWVIAQENSDTITLTPWFTMKVEYDGDLLVTRRVEMHYEGDKIKLKNDQTNIVSPLYKDISVDDLNYVKRPDMNAKYYCDFAVLKRQDTYMKETIVSLHKSKDPKIRFDEDDEALNFGIHGDILRDLGELARGVFSGQRTEG